MDQAGKESGCLAIAVELRNVWIHIHRLNGSFKFAVLRPPGLLTSFGWRARVLLPCGAAEGQLPSASTCLFCY